jgi:N-acylneuraminate cytidylyltransferase
MVSTDDTEIAQTASALGAKVPFMRSAETSNDFASTAAVVDEVLNEYQKQGKTFDFVCCCYATAAFVTPGKLKAAFEILKNKRVDCVTPVVKAKEPIVRALEMDSNILKHMWPEYKNSRSQDQPTLYFETGQFYFFQKEAFLAQKTLLMERTFGLEVPQSECQDIDTKEDWEEAEQKFLNLHNSTPSKELKGLT